MIPAAVRIFVCTEPVDMRYGFDRLASTAKSRIGEDPQHGGALFVLANRGADHATLCLPPSECPDKRLVARELEARWETALRRVYEVERRLAEQRERSPQAASIDRERLLALARDLPAVWNAASADMRTKQRIVRILVQEVIVDVDTANNETVITIHWVGGRHSDVRVARVRGRYPAEQRPSAVDVMRKLGGQWPDRELAVTLNRMRCRTEDGGTWTVVRVRQLRERLDIAEFQPQPDGSATVSADEAARRLGIWIGSVHRLIRERVLPATQLLPSAPWQIPIAALESAAVSRRPAAADPQQPLRVAPAPPGSG